MSHADVPHREPPRDSDPSSSRDQRIEQLLLAGLDRYFAGDLERAIQVWSRVFFLDRGHPRARAYIDRARGAIAERQREAEARGHSRVEATGSAALDVDGVTWRSVDLIDGGLDVFQARQSPIGPSSGIAASGAALSHVLAARPALDVEDPFVAQPALTPQGTSTDEGRRRTRAVTHVLLVLLAALLLFGAGYVVAARDRLAEWWAPSGEPALAIPAMAPESSAPARPNDPGARSSTPPRGTAKR